jgi:hypothetical protein
MWLKRSIFFGGGHSSFSLYAHDSIDSTPTILGIWIRIPWFVNTLANSLGVNERTIGRNATGDSTFIIEKLRPSCQTADDLPASTDRRRLSEARLYYTNLHVTSLPELRSPRLRNPVRERRAKSRSRSLMIRTKKKSHRTVEVADPDFGGAGVEIERAFFVDLGWGVRWRKDLDADFRCASEKDGFLVNLRTFLPEPRNVGRLDSIGSRNGAFGERRAVGEQALEESGDSRLAARVPSSGRWTHDDMSMPIGLDPVGEPGELRISHELAPTGEVEAGLRLEIGKLNGDGHELTKSMKAPRKQ